MRGWKKLFAVSLLVSGLALADNTAQTLPFTQNWTNAGLITTNDVWTGVPGIVGYRGDDITAAIGADPQTLVGEGTITVDVNANQTAPNTFATGGVTEFDIADDVVALTGSGTADAPNIIINLNTSGQSLVNVAYNLRDIDGSVDNAVQPVALQYRVGSSGNFTNLPSGFVADASSGPSLATLVTPVSVTLPAAADNQALVQVRIITANASGNDEWIGIDDINITGTPTGSLPGSFQFSSATYSIAENGGSATITVNRTGGSSGAVSVDYATSNGTALTADNDYTASSGTLNFADTEISKTFSVPVINDATVEPDETVNLTLSSPTGGAALGAPSTGVLTITNDDIVLTSIHTIQGSGDASPLVGNSITTRGIVTGLRNNGFFLQTADADADADPATSQGIFVFTSSTPPASAVIGNSVQVTANVVEFFQLTELSAPTVSLLSTGNPLPTAITLTAADGALPTPERYEAMRVIPNLTVVAPAGGNENEPNATATSSGNFHGVLPGVARPFREPGVSVLDAFVPAPGVTVFDGNLELIVVQSKGLGGANMNPNAGDVMTGISGILDFGFGFYKFYPDAGQTFTSAVTPTAVSDAAVDEFTVAGFNLFRFFDTIDAPGISDPILTATALNNRLGKTAEAICSFLKTPDVIGVVEVENIGVLTQLADTINDGQVPTGNAVPACNTAPEYVPYLVEGNDVGGIDVGFLISTKIVGGATPRVEVLEVVQENDGELLVNPDNSTSTLNDRPTLRLQAVIHHPNGNSYPVTVMINHMRSLGSVNSTAPEGNGWASEGHRVRAKRLKQAESLAALVNARQIANPNEKIILLGDFNAFEFNDGFVDSMGIITGQEVPASEVTLHSGFVVATPLTTMTTVDPANERYSFTFDGSAQSLDHAVVNEAVLMNDGVRSEHARINADFAVINYGLYGAAPIRVSDHDPVVLYVKPKSFGNIDLSVAVSNPDANVNAGNTTTFTVNANNLDEGLAADNAVVSIVLDAAINGVNVTAPVDWSCAAPVVAAASTTIDCTTSTFAALGAAGFSVSVPVPVEFLDGDLTLSATISAEQGDTNPANNIGSDFVTVIGQEADLAIRTRGASKIYVGYKTRINTVADNYGPDAARNVAVAITTNGPKSAFKITTVPSGWACALDAAYATARFLCNLDAGLTMERGTRPEFVLTFTAPASMASGNLIVGAGISSSTTDPSAGNNEDSYSLMIEQLRVISPPQIPSN